MIRESWEVLAGEVHDLNARRTIKRHLEGEPEPYEGETQLLPFARPHVPAQTPGQASSAPAADRRPSRSSDDISVYHPAPELYPQDALDVVEGAGFHPVGEGEWHRTKDQQTHVLTYRPGYRLPGGQLAPWHLSVDDDEISTPFRSASMAIQAADGLNKMAAFTDWTDGSSALAIPAWERTAASADDFYNELYGQPEGSQEDEWHRFDVLPHPEIGEDRNTVGISVRRLPDEPEPRAWRAPGEDPKFVRSRFNWTVHENGEPVISEQPFWGPAVSRRGNPTGHTIDHEEVARSIANGLGSDAYSLPDLGTPEHDLSTPEKNYNGMLGYVTYDDATGEPVTHDQPYSRQQVEFLSRNAMRLRHAGREYPYDFDDRSESTLVPYDQTPKGSDLRAVNPKQVKNFNNRYGAWRDWSEYGE